MLLDANRQAEELANERFSMTKPERDHARKLLAQGVSPVKLDTPVRAAARAQMIQRSMPGLDLQKESGLVDIEATMVGVAEAETIGLERVINQPNFMGAWFFKVGLERCKSVCCIQSRGQRIGTGWMMGQGLLITNAHVLSSESDARTAVAEFEYEEEPNGSMASSVIFELDPEKFFVSSPVADLDYAVVAVRPMSKTGNRSLEEFGYLRLIAQTGKALLGEWLNIIQHPDGRPKSVAMRDNQFIAMLDKYLHYETDTQPGSSGSPVLNDQWEVVCLHHAGVAKRDEQGRYMLKDGRRVAHNQIGPSDEPLIQWIGNEGIRISRILPDLWTRSRAKGLDRKLLGVPQPDFNGQEEEQSKPRATDKYDGSVASNQQPDVTNDSSDVSSNNSNSSPNVSHNVQVRSDGSSGITIDLPLRISISFGPAVVSDAASMGVGPRNPLVSTPQASDPVTMSEAEAIELLEAGRKRTYYDKPKDNADRSRYYAGIGSANASGFREKLRNLVTSTHKRSLPYDTARVKHLYAWVDLQRSKMVRSIYSNQEYDPENFIRADFYIERRVTTAINERRAMEASMSDAALEALRLELEANDPFNCEHVVPQSWFGKAEPMRGDLHHLFACESKCNSTRNNHPYADHNVFDVEASKTYRQCGHLQDGAFEPFMGKGKASRAVLYFLLRYPGKANQTRNEYRGAQLQVLLDWHDRYPVNEHELHRNQAIFETQGNRNPFIDHPDWARSVYQ